MGVLVFNRKITFLNGPFSSTPCLITGEYPNLWHHLLKMSLKFQPHFLGRHHGTHLWVPWNACHGVSMPRAKHLTILGSGRKPLSIINHTLTLVKNSYTMGSMIVFLFSSKNHPILGTLSSYLHKHIQVYKMHMHKEYAYSYRIIQIYAVISYQIYLETYTLQQLN